MKLNKKVKIVLIVLLFPILIIGLYLAMSYVFARIPAHQKVFEGEKDKVIYVHSNGLHLDIALPKEIIDKDLLSQLNISEEDKFVSYGWGDKGFYLETADWENLKISIALKAIFLPSETAMHVTRYLEVKEHWIAVKIGEEQLQILNEYLTASFTKDDNKIIELENTGGYGTNDSFYEAEKSYHMIRTCNVWVNSALKKIGVKTSVWCPFDWGVLNFLKD